jgi:hypothetical protein
MHQELKPPDSFNGHLHPKISLIHKIGLFPYMKHEDSRTRPLDYDFFNWYNWVHSALQPPIGLLCQPRVIMMMEKLVEWWMAGEIEVLGENLPQCRFVQHKPHMLCPDANPGRRGGKPATNRLSYGTASIMLSVNARVQRKYKTHNTMLHIRLLHWSHLCVPK